MGTVGVGEREEKFGLLNDLSEEEEEEEGLCVRTLGLTVNLREQGEKLH